MKDKTKMINDIVLTLSLIISALISRIIMDITNLEQNKYNCIIFFAFTFIIIKITYNVALMILRKKNIL